ncbi:MAG: hypothetical protein GXO90_10070 [FCB group bacterium]|nr:hypothetical protein [FCB group bacterium]
MVRLLPVMFIFLLTSCNPVSEDPFPPAAPEWIAKSLPEAWNERGIDAESSGASGIILMWQPNTESDLAGYVLYRADSTGSNTFRPIMEIDLMEIWTSDTSYIDAQINPYVDYYYYLTARDQAGNESPPSDTLTYRLMLRCQLLDPVDQSVVLDSLSFSWVDPVGNYTYTQEYVLRIDQLDPVPHTAWITRFYQRWYSSQSSGDPIQVDWFPSPGPWPDYVSTCRATRDSLEPGLYRWKIKNLSEVDNATGLDECSGESEWALFELRTR